MRLRTATAIFIALLAAQAVAVVLTAGFGMVFLVPFVLLLAFTFATFMVTTVWSVLSGAPFVPTDARNVDAMIRVASVRAGERVVDLGSGDGRILIAAAKAGAHAEGWEISPYLWLLSKWNIRRAGVADRARVHLGSYWGQRFPDADVVTLFLITFKMPRMKEKLLQELPRGARVVSYAFRFPQWPIAVSGGNGVHLYLIDDLRALSRRL
jgi:SAM-dependent methyltransferase